MRSTWNLPFVTSLTLAASNDSTKAAPDAAKPAATGSKPERSSKIGVSRPGTGKHARPDIKRVQSFASRRRNK